LTDAQLAAVSGDTPPQLSRRRRSAMARPAALADSDTVCCRTFAQIAADAVLDAQSSDGTGCSALLPPAHETLARVLVAALMDMRVGNVGGSAAYRALETATEEAAEFLQSTCDGSQASRAVHLTHALLANEHAPPHCRAPLPWPTHYAEYSEQCSGVTPNALYCDGAGTWLEMDGRCECEPGRAALPDCSALECSGHGVSLPSDAPAPLGGAHAPPRCVCAPGWTGAECEQCDVQQQYTCVSAGGGAQYVLRLGSGGVQPGTKGLDCGCQSDVSAATAATAATQLDAVLNMMDGMRAQLLQTSSASTGLNWAWTTLIIGLTSVIFVAVVFVCWVWRAGDTSEEKPKLR